jgi:hypothetical protein
MLRPRGSVAASRSGRGVILHRRQGSRRQRRSVRACGIASMGWPCGARSTTLARQGRGTVRTSRRADASPHWGIAAGRRARSRHSLCTGWMKLAGSVRIGRATASGYIRAIGPVMTRDRRAALALCRSTNRVHREHEDAEHQHHTVLHDPPAAVATVPLAVLRADHRIFRYRDARGGISLRRTISRAGTRERPSG